MVDDCLHIHKSQNTITTSGPQQSPSSKLHASKLFMSSQNPSPIKFVNRHSSSFVDVVEIVGVVVDVSSAVDSIVGVPKR